MSETEIAALAALSAARAAGRAWTGFPAGLRPRDEAAAYRLQAGLWRNRFPGAQPAGWKIGCTTPVMQQYLKITHPCAGTIAAPAIHGSGVRLPRDRLVRPGVECELAVRLARDLAPEGAPYSRDSVAPAVDAVMAAIEVVDERYEDFRALDTWTLVADDFFQAAAVLGPPHTDWADLALDRIAGRMVISGTVVGEGTGAAVLGHPFEALAWLANNRSQFGDGLLAGQIVLTGSIVETRWVEAGDTVEVHLDGLGPATARFG